MRKELIESVAWAGGIIALSLAATFALKQGYIDGDAASRITLCATGLMVAWYGNRLPKTLAPSVYVQRVNRVAGWSMALSGLIYAGLWALAPFSVALVGGCGAILVGIAVTVCYCMSLRARAKAA